MTPSSGLTGGAELAPGGGRGQPQRPEAEEAVFPGQEKFPFSVFIFLDIIWD